MAIRNHKSPQSSVEKQEDDWFRKASIHDEEFGRFGYMEKGTRGGFWEYKKDISLESISLNDSEFIIDHDKFINRPDAIAHEVYGNSKYWWLIALRNDIKNPFYEFHKGRVLKIPNLELARTELGF